MFNILVVDDDRDLRASLISHLALNTNYRTFESKNGLEAIEVVKNNKIDMVLLDVDMPELNGLETLKRIKSSDPRIIVIMITAYSNLKDAIESIRIGAYNYIEKPIKHSELFEIVSRALKANKLIEAMAFSAPILKINGKHEFVGSSSEMQKIYTMIQKLAKVDTAVLIRGESGTGKELVAQALHYNSPRKNEKFVPVNCSAITDTLIESELFGHEKGSFTGAHQRKIGKFQFADGGTLFLDEIGDISPNMQVKLLRVLQEKRFIPVGANREIEVNVRIIAATNRNLEQMIRDGHFREDLYYRLNVLPIFLPPLRDRTDDIHDLINYFIAKFNDLHNKVITNISRSALDAIKKYSWPGNIRELENVIEHAFVIEGSHELTLSSFPENILGLVRREDSKPHITVDNNILDFQVVKENFEKNFIINALKSNKGKINQTALNANIPKKTLLRKIEKYNISPKEFYDK